MKSLPSPLWGLELQVPKLLGLLAHRSCVKGTQQWCGLRARHGFRLGAQQNVHPYLWLPVLWNLGSPCENQNSDSTSPHTQLKVFIAEAL
jgi:hypothetical protein